MVIPLDGPGTVRRWNRSCPVVSWLSSQMLAAALASSRRTKRQRVTMEITNARPTVRRISISRYISVRNIINICYFLFVFLFLRNLSFKRISGNFSETPCIYLRHRTFSFFSRDIVHLWQFHWKDLHIFSCYYRNM